MRTQQKLEWLARSGYAARGVVYILIAGLALLSTFGSGGPDSKSALQAVLEQPFGRIWLGLIGSGLIGFVLWRVAQSLLNTDRHDSDLKGYAVRAGLLVSAATYVGLATFAIGHALQLGLDDGSSDGKQSLAAWLMRQPFGPYLVAIVGIAMIGAATAQIAKGLKRRYARYFERNWQDNRVLDAICIFGLAARGAILLIVGVFFLYAAFAVDPSQAGSTSDAMAWIRQLPFGALLYGVAALGLFAFGLYGLIEARYRIVNPPSMAAPVRAAAALVR